MLVILSDLHLNDGTVCLSSDQGASWVFLDDLKTLAAKASKREDGTIKVIDDIDIVLNGDIFDLIRSDIWNERGIRPWDDISQWADLVTEVAERIAEKNSEFCQVFRDLSQYGLTYNLGGTRNVTASVKIHYLVGNHDWFMRHPSELLDKLRSTVRESLGLHQEHFPWNLEENTLTSQDIRDVCFSHKVYVRHGDLYDKVNYHSSFGRNFASLGDAIVIEIVNNIPNIVERKIKEKYPDEELPHKLLSALEELDNIRPSTHSVIYLRNVVDKLAGPKYKKIILDAMDECNSGLVNSQMFKKVLKSKHILTALSAFGIQFAAKYSPTFFVRKVLKFSEMFESSYMQNASREKFIKNGICKFVVYGHTHSFELEGIASKQVDGKIQNSVYINSATWRPIHLEIRTGTEEFPYVTKKTMTWVVFYKDGERSGREYETWTGNIGVN